jgi:L-iditol 2-dehydrogenase
VKALVKRTGARVLQLEDVPDPVPGPEDVVVDVAAVGICGTDVHILNDAYAHADPLVPGHELVGRIAAVGERVEGWSEGQRVVSELHTGADRDCPICRSGNPQICPRKRALGTWIDGGFAERVKLPAWLLHAVPDGVSDLAATLVEPAACSLHGMLERGRIEEGDRVLVAGHGPIGLLGAQIAQAAGAAQVILTGRSRKGTTRLDAARRLGVDVIDSDREDVAARVLELTGGDGVDVAVEAAGSQATVWDCIGACRPGGRVIVLGLAGRPSIEFPMDLALVRDLDVHFSFSSKDSSWRRVLDLSAAGRLGDEAFVTHRFDLHDWDEAFAATAGGQAVKVVLHP